MIRDDLAALNIRHEVFFSERTLHEKQQRRLEDRRRDRRAARAGASSTRAACRRPRGNCPTIGRIASRPCSARRDFGDDVDRPLKKSDGSHTYFAADIAYHKAKIDRGFDTLVDVWGADHGGYVKRMSAAVAALSDRKVALDVKLCQLVKLMRDGEPVKMSKRSGDFVTLREVVDEVGVDAVRFMMLYRKNDAPLEFDLAKVIEQSKDNPSSTSNTLMRAENRCCGRRSPPFPDLDLSAEALAGAPLDLLEDEGEIALAQDDRAISARDRSGRGGA